MKNNFALCMRNIFKWEGGYSDHPKDHGGKTKYGITQATLSDHLGRPATDEEIKNLTKAMARKIYREDFWNVLHCDALPKGLDLIVFDMGVNAGTGRSAKMLQELVGVEPDGIIGPRSKRAIEKYASVGLIEKFYKAREEFYRSRDTFDTFGAGWLNRNNDIYEKSVKMFNGKLQSMPTVEGVTETVKNKARPASSVLAVFGAAFGNAIIHKINMDHGTEIPELTPEIIVLLLGYAGTHLGLRSFEKFKGVA